MRSRGQSYGDREKYALIQSAERVKTARERKKIAQLRQSEMGIIGDDRKGTQIDRVMLSLRIGKIAPMVNFQSSRVCHSGPTRERKST